MTLGLLGLAAIVIFARLGAGSLYDWDEAIYAEVAKEVAGSDEWLTPTFGHIPYWHKPPLYIWLTAVTYKAFGTSEFAARFWSAFFGFGVVALTIFLGARLFSWATGMGAALLLLSVDHAYFAHWYNFVSQARVGMIETTLTFWIILSLIFAWEAKERPWLIGFIGLTAGLAVMTKSWVGLLAVALSFIHSTVTRQVYVQRRYWAIAAALAATIALPWHLWELWLYGSAFLHDYVVVNLVGRMVGLVQQDSRGLFFYFDVIRTGFPFGHAWLLAYAWLFWSARRDPSRQKVLLLLWITIPVLMFSVARTKLGWYVILVYPAIALSTAQAVVEWFPRRLAVSVLAAAMALLYFRLPIPSDGSAETKEFARKVGQLVNYQEPIYMQSGESCDAPGSLTTYSHAGQWYLSPSLLYYIERPISCLAPEAAPVQPPNHRYVIVDTSLSRALYNLPNVLLREGQYFLQDASVGAGLGSLNNLWPPSRWEN
jgi:4-amino-4-deoxy-L-arabinose transferase-like glycosyltransferase